MAKERAGARDPRAQWGLALLMALALILRVWGLGQVPSGIDSDEASIGYNAYAIARTGMDEYGAAHPLAFRAYGEYKRPAYVYAAVPSVALLGLTPFSVRLPAAIFGALSVAALYAVATLLLRDWRAGLIAAGLLAISPWHLQFTRAAREASVLVLALLVFAAALLAGLAGRRQRSPWWYVVAALAFLVALYSYPGALLLAPLLLAVLLRAFWPRVAAAPRRWLLGAAAVVVVGSLPLAVQLVDGRARARLDQASLLNAPGLQALSARRLERDRAEGMPWLLDTPVALAARQAVDNYLAHFNPTYLFTQGDPEWRHHASDTGQLYLWDAPLLLAGLVALVRRWRLPAMQAIGGWLLVAPLPAAFAEQAPHAVRSIGMLPALYLMAAAGAPAVWRWLEQRHFHRDALLLLGLSTAFYLYSYHRYYPVERARDWNAGVLEGYRAAQTEVDGKRFTRVVIPEEMGLSYAYALFATQYDPARYLAQGGSRVDPTWDSFPAPGPMRFEPFEVRKVDWAIEPRDPSVLYVLEGASRPPAGTQVAQVTRSPDGSPALQLVYFPV